MDYSKMKKAQLIEEIEVLQEKVAELERVQTERKRAEEVLQESEERYRSFVQNLDGIAYRGNVNFEPEFFHGAVEKMTGYTEQDFMEGKIRWDSIIHKDDLPGYLEKVKERIEDKPLVAESEFRIVHRNGSIRWIHEIFQTVFDDSGQVIGSQGIQHDITERKQAEEALQESEEHFRSLVTGASDVITMTDLEGNILFINEAGKTLHGVDDLNALIGRNAFFSLIAEESLESAREGMEIVLRKGVAKNREYVLVRDDGKKVPVEMTVSVIRDVGGKPFRFMAITRDITERVRAEEALRESEASLARAQQIAHLGNWDWDVEGATLTWSDEVYRIFGIEREFELTYEGIEAMVHPDDRERNQEFVNELLATADSADIEFRIIRPDGAVRRIYQNAEVRRDEAGNANRVFGIMQDITERKRVEESLRRREQEIRAIAENVPALVSYVDMDGCYRFVNRRYEEWFGVPRTEIVGKHYRQVLGDETYEQIRDRVEVALSGQRVSYEEALAYARGGTRWVMADYVPDADDGGKVNGFFALVTDITERKQAEEALRESEERYRSLFDGVPVGICRTTPDGQILDINPALVQMMSFPDRETALAATPTDGYVNPEDRIRWQALIHREEVVRNFKTQLRRLDGTTIWVEMDARAVQDADGRVLHYEISVEDITERKQAEEALWESEERYRQLVELSPETIAVHSEGKIVFINTAGAKLLGAADPDQLIGKPIMDFLHPDYRDTVKGRIGQIGEEGEEAPVVEEKFIRLDGTVVDVEVAAIPFTYQGRPAVQAIARDITERKQAEEALRESEQRLSNFMNSATDGFILFDSEMNVVEINRVALKIFGVGRDVIGKSAVDVSPDVVKSGRYDKYMEVMRTGKPFFADDVVPHRKFGDIHLAIRAFKVGDGLGTIVTNITERKQAEEALCHSLEETARGQRTLLALSQAAQAVQRARRPEEVYQTIGDEVAGLGYNAVILTLTDDRKHLLVSHHTFRTAPERAAERIMGLSVRDLRLPVVPGGVVHRLIFYGEAIFSEEKASEFVAEALPGFLRPLASRLTALLKLERRIMAPLTVGDEEFGLLIVTGAGLTEADVPAITAFANQAAIAIENARLFEQVQAGRDRLKLLTRQVVSAQEEERQHLARELHDELGQALTGISFDLSAIKRELPPELDPKVTKRLASASSLLSQTDEWVSELALDLRPYMLDDLGLVSALRWYANRYAKRLDIEVEMEAIDFEGRLTPELETALYRVVQEALTNVAKHAQANQVKIRLERKKAAVAAIVEDDGQGFDVETMAGPSAPERGAGLLGMRERASFLGGTLSIESTPGKGTRLAIEIPV
jgi:PAS domain S-box-containing protein